MRKLAYILSFVMLPLAAMAGYKVYTSCINVEK